MGLKELRKALQSFDKIALDSSALIYFVEGNTRYLELVNEIFNLLNDGRIRGFTSMITLTEVLVYPFENNLEKLQNVYLNLLLATDAFQTLEVQKEISVSAAKLRAKYKVKNIKTPDAIQIATAIYAGCDAFISNDKRLKQVTEIEVLILDDYLNKVEE